MKFKSSSELLPVQILIPNHSFSLLASSKWPRKRMDSCEDYKYQQAGQICKKIKETNKNN